jgi:hypothetical protein
MLRGHPFYRRLNAVLDNAGFDEFCEAQCHKFCHERLGRPSLAPGMYFRVMLVGLVAAFSDFMLRRQRPQHCERKSQRSIALREPHPSL